MPEQFDSYLLCFKNIMLLKWCALTPWTHSLCLYQKMDFTVSTSPSFLCPQRYWQRKNQSWKSTSAKHSMWNAGNKQRPEQAESPSGTEGHSYQTRWKGDSRHICTQSVQWNAVAKPGWSTADVGAAESTMLNCPCLYQLGREVIQIFKFSTVPFFYLLFSVGAKLHTGISTQFLKHPQRKYFPQSSS